MTTQDNNEAASAPNVGSDYAEVLARQLAQWTKERDRLQRMIDAASASQSSTAGAASVECKECEGLGCYGDPSGPGSIDCSYCDGTGKAQQGDCATCYGIGHFVKTMRNGETVRSECVACGGSGKHAEATRSPVPRVGGNTSDEVGAFAIRVEKLLCNALGRAWTPSGMSIESLVSDLVHVARQRQESAVDAALKDAVIHGTGMYIAKPDGSAEHVSPEQFRAAVAEGVDTADFWKLVRKFSTAPEGAPRDEAKRAVLAYIDTTYGAQQREAGRRDRDAALAEQAATMLAQRKKIQALEKELALARQPVSEGLTFQQYWDSLPCDPEADESTVASCRYAAENAWNSALSAVPPAKAEGMSNDDFPEKVRIWSAEIVRLVGVAETVYGQTCGALESLFETADYMRSAAILAQQAKKGGAA